MKNPTQRIIEVIFEYMKGEEILSTRVEMPYALGISDDKKKSKNALLNCGTRPLAKKHQTKILEYINKNPALEKKLQKQCAEEFEEFKKPPSLKLYEHLRGKEKYTDEDITDEIKSKQDRIVRPIIETLLNEPFSLPIKQLASQLYSQYKSPSATSQAKSELENFRERKVSPSNNGPKPHFFNQKSLPHLLAIIVEHKWDTNEKYTTQYNNLNNLINELESIKATKNELAKPKMKPHIIKFEPKSTKSKEKGPKVWRSILEKTFEFMKQEVKEQEGVKITRKNLAYRLGLTKIKETNLYSNLAARHEPKLLEYIYKNPVLKKKIQEDSECAAEFKILEDAQSTKATKITLENSQPMEITKLDDGFEIKAFSQPEVTEPGLSEAQSTEPGKKISVDSRPTPGGKRFRSDKELLDANKIFSNDNAKRVRVLNGPLPSFRKGY
jgi:hypothetical protein